MTHKHEKPPTPPPEPSRRDDSDETRDRFARPAAFILGSGVSWAMRLAALVVLAIGGLLLTLAWQAGPQVAWWKHDYARLTGKADATVVESWLALEIDIPTIRVPANWRASALAAPCVVVDLAGDWGAARRRAFCGNRFGFSDSYDPLFVRQLALRVPFDWQRDDRGFAMVDVRVTPEAREWLASHTPNTFMHRQWPARNSLEWLQLELNRPVDAAIAGWTAQPPTLQVVYDPQEPSVQYPRGLVEERLARSPSWIVAFVFGAIGLAIWAGGMRLLPGMDNFSAPGRWIITLLPLVALPWFASHFPEAMRSLNTTLGEVVSDVFNDIDPLDRFAATDPDDATLARGERIANRTGEGPYADTFGRLRFKPPASPAPSADSALAALAQSVTVQLQAAEPAERAAFFAALARDKRLDLRAAGLLYVPSAREALIDPATDPAVARAARAFLWEWVTQPIEAPDPHAPAYKQRMAITESLVDVPVPEIANMARRR